MDSMVQGMLEQNNPMVDHYQRQITMVKARIEQMGDMYIGYTAAISVSAPFPNLNPKLKISDFFNFKYPNYSEFFNFECLPCLSDIVRVAAASSIPSKRHLWMHSANPAFCVISLYSGGC